ncbi:MAG: VOC family protein [Alphaproteobacteria bacterium]|nr:VOC family protein [Alphaproteobacteria bacterium]MBV9542260.1 VOC family protein [Alphaproteobacteria bacterium]
MQLAKPRVDIGLNTNNLDAMLKFWQGEAGVPFDHLLPIRKGQNQHRHDLNGSVLKINYFDTPLPNAPRAGYAEVLIAKPGLSAMKVLTDPEGVVVSLVPPGTLGISQAGIKLKVRDLENHRKFYADALGLTEVAHARGAAFQAGETVLMLEESDDAPKDAEFQGPGFRYITFQVFKCDEEHARILEKGGREAVKPVTLGTTARISMVRDPDGNWIEISQRASITGSLE